MRRIVLLTYAVVALAACPAEAGRFHVLPGAAPSGAGSLAGRVETLIELPLFTLGQALRVLPGAGWRRAEIADGQSFDRRDGWRVVGFEVQDSGRGLYLEITGRLQFDRAQVVFVDGEMRELDLGGVTRPAGLFELVEFGGGERGVIGARLRARSASAHARVGIRIGK